MSDSPTRSGNRVVVVVYLLIVAVAGTMGYVLGSLDAIETDPELFFLIQLPPTALGMALFGVVTVGLGLGLLLLLVAYVSRRYDVESS
ncbi:MAG: cox cluster protein [Haloarculaceae archaeon]